MANNVYRLSVRRGPEEGQTFPLTSTSVTVGRDPMADIVLSDPEVSRQHARFTRTEEGYQLQDLGSTNGTFVDGKRLGGEAVSLQPGAVITMGSNMTLVLEGTADPMATVVSPGSDLDFDEPEEPEDDDALRTMIESPEEEAEDLPSFESPAADFDDDAMVSEGESTAMEFPSAADTGPLGTPPAEEPEDDFSFDFEEADYGEPVGPSSGVDPDDRTVLDMEASDFSSFSAEEDDDALPSFDELSYGAESELPSFEEEPEPAAKPPAESPDRIPPPPPSPPPKSESDPNRNRNIMIGVIALLLLCCCCSILLTYFYLGDIILQYMQF